MTVETWTHRAVVDLFPDFLLKRRRGYLPEGQALASELGVQWLSIVVLNQGVMIAQDSVVSVARHRWRSPYATKEPWSAQWADLVRAGLAITSPQGWRIEPAGYAAISRFNSGARGYLSGLSLPAEPLARLRAALVPLARAIPADSERALGPRRIAPTPQEERADIVAIEQAIYELWGRRDDCHIGAWQDAGYEGPALDALSEVWEGQSSLEGVAKKLESKQEPADVERSIAALIARGDVAREGQTLRITPQGQVARDRIEAETDRRYFAGWPSGEALAAVGQDLRALIEALP